MIKVPGCPGTAYCSLVLLIIFLSSLFRWTHWPWLRSEQTTWYVTHSVHLLQLVSWQLASRISYGKWPITITASVKEPTLTYKACDFEIWYVWYGTVHGGWSEWEELDCIGTCFSANRTRRRTCTNPAPLYEGRLCRGVSEDMVKCIPEHCNCEWIFLLATLIRTVWFLKPNPHTSRIQTLPTALLVLQLNWGAWCILCMT